MRVGNALGGTSGGRAKNKGVMTAHNGIAGAADSFCIAINFCIGDIALQGDGIIAGIEAFSTAAKAFHIAGDEC